jgi:hypothetical protein
MVKELFSIQCEGRRSQTLTIPFSHPGETKDVVGHSRGSSLFQSRHNMLQSFRQGLANHGLYYTHKAGSNENAQ